MGAKLQITNYKQIPKKEKKKTKTKTNKRKEFWSQIGSGLLDGIAGHEKMAEGRNNRIEFFPEHWNKGDRIKRESA